MSFRKLHFVWIAGLFFSLVYAASYSFFQEPPQQSGIPPKTLEEINQLSERVSDILEKRESIKNTSIQKMIDEGQNGEFRLLYRDWSVKLHQQGTSKPKTSNTFFTRVGTSEFSLAVPVGKYEVKGVIVVTKKMPTVQEAQSNFLHPLFFSFAITSLFLSLLAWKKARNLTKPIDRLCQQFTKYRRENENSDIELPQVKQKQSPLSRRVDILEDLWSRFQSVQYQLKDNVEALRRSEKEKEATIQELERAKVQERRLVELGHALAEFGHDIGNANGAIMSFVSLILNILEQKTVGAMELTKCLVFIRRIKIASTTVSGLTSDILEFAKGKTELNVAEVQLNDFVAKLEVNLGFNADMPTEFDFPEDQNLCLKMDEGKILRVIVNLVKNAWEKLDEEEGEILISFRPGENQRLTVAVTDNGHPIPDGILQNLFKPFATQGKAEGTGLGLAICKKIVDAHGGNIQAENLSQNSGVRFSFALPNCVGSQAQSIEAMPLDNSARRVS